jgi:hypothetical protein
VDQGHLRSFRKYKNLILTFLHITVKDTDMKHVLNVTGDICNTLDMAPWVNPNSQKLEIAEYMYLNNYLDPHS